MGVLATLRRKVPAKLRWQLCRPTLHGSPREQADHEVQGKEEKEDPDLVRAVQGQRKAGTMIEMIDVSGAPVPAPRHAVETVETHRQRTRASGGLRPQALVAAGALLFSRQPASGPRCLVRLRHRRKQLRHRVSGKSEADGEA